jgi:hypothetical protein
MTVLLTGDIREAMAQELRDSLERIINENQDKPDYYILMTARWVGATQLKTTFILLSKTKFLGLQSLFENGNPRLLSTMCWQVRNDEGQLIRKWSLPWDIPLMGLELKEGPRRVVEETVEEAMEVPILH